MIIGYITSEQRHIHTPGTTHRIVGVSVLSGSMTYRGQGSLWDLDGPGGAHRSDPELPEGGLRLSRVAVGKAHQSMDVTVTLRAGGH